MLTFSKISQRERRPGAATAPVTEADEREMEAWSPERDEIVRRLRLQGAVQVLPTRYTGTGAPVTESGMEAESSGPQSSAPESSVPASSVPEPQVESASTGAGASGTNLAPDRQYEGVMEYLALERLSKQIRNLKDTGVEPDIPDSLRQRLEAHEKGTIPMAKWYRKRALEYEKEREEQARIEAEWYHPTRERSGNRDRDRNMLQHIEDFHTQEYLRKMNPGLLDIRQRWQNYKEDFKQHKARKIVSYVPVVGSGIAQYGAAREAGKNRDVMSGMSQVQHDEQLAELTRSQAQAVDKTITAGWVKAGIGTVTDVAGFLSPVPGVGTAANKVAGKLVDMAYSDSGKIVQEMTARMKARRTMRNNEYRDYADEQEYILLEKLAEQFRKGGQGDEDSGMMSTLDPELQRRLMAHINGMIGNREEMEKRAKALLKEREEQFNAGMEPKPQTGGLLAKFKSLFTRSKGNQTG